MATKRGLGYIYDVLGEYVEHVETPTNTMPMSFTVTAYFHRVALSRQWQKAKPDP